MDSFRVAYHQLGVPSRGMNMLQDHLTTAANATVALSPLAAAAGSSTGIVGSGTGGDSCFGVSGKSFVLGALGFTGLLCQVLVDSGFRRVGLRLLIMGPSAGQTPLNPRDYAESSSPVLFGVHPL